MSSVCIQCGQTYSKEKALEIIKSLPYSFPMGYDNLCLECTKASLQEIKLEKKEGLKELKATLDAAHKAYQQAGSEWQAQAKIYQDLDYIENMIAHKQKPTIIKPKTDRKPKTKKPKKSKAEILALKVLANLPPEQQQAIIANLRG